MDLLCTAGIVGASPWNPAVETIGCRGMPWSCLYDWVNFNRGNGWNIPYIKAKIAGKIGNPRIRRILFHCHVWLPEGISMNIPLFYIIITFYHQNPVLPGTFRDRKSGQPISGPSQLFGRVLAGRRCKVRQVCWGPFFVIHRWDFYQPQRSPPRKQYWLVVWNIFHFSIYWE